MSIAQVFRAICPFHIGQRVTVSPNCKYASEWPGDYAVVGIFWEYQSGERAINITIASDDDIKHRHGSTDGWSPEDLLAVRT